MTQSDDDITSFGSVEKNEYKIFMNNPLVWNKFAFIVSNDTHNQHHLCMTFHHNFCYLIIGFICAYEVHIPSQTHS
jgi:hypothetical protein